MKIKINKHTKQPKNVASNIGLCLKGFSLTLSSQSTRVTEQKSNSFINNSFIGPVPDTLIY